jgi:hypothetical protein
MKTFKEYVMQEDNTAGAGGVFGDASSMGHGGAVGNSDFYAPGDMRIPKFLGTTVVGKKGKKKRVPLVQRRSLFKYF